MTGSEIHLEINCLCLSGLRHFNDRLVVPNLNVSAPLVHCLLAAFSVP